MVNYNVGSLGSLGSDAPMPVFLQLRLYIYSETVPNTTKTTKRGGKW